MRQNLLSCDSASSKERLQFARAFRRHVGNVRIVRRHFRCRVGQQATEGNFKRALNDFGQEGCDRPTWRQRPFHARDAGWHVDVQIAIETLREECPSIAEGVAEARGAQAHGITEIAHRGGGTAGSPKAPHRGLKSGTLVELTGSGQPQSTKLASYWIGRYKTFRRLASAGAR